MVLITLNCSYSNTICDLCMYQHVHERIILHILRMEFFFDENVIVHHNDLTPCSYLYHYVRDLLSAWCGIDVGCMARFNPDICLWGAKLINVETWRGGMFSTGMCGNGLVMVSYWAGGGGGIFAPLPGLKPAWVIALCMHFNLVNTYTLRLVYKAVCWISSWLYNSAWWQLSQN